MEEYFENIHVGCICAGIMEGNIFAAKERDHEMRNRVKRKHNYLKRRWRQTRNGSHAIRYKKQWVTITPSKFEAGRFGVICDKGSVWEYKGKKIPDFQIAVNAAFDYIDPPIKGQIQ